MPDIGDQIASNPAAAGSAILATHAGAYIGTAGGSVTANDTWTEYRSADPGFRTLFTPTYACVIVGQIGLPIEAYGDASSPYRLDRNVEATVGLDRVRAGAAVPYRWRVRPDSGGSAGNPPYFKANIIIPFNLALTANVEHELTVFARSDSDWTLGTVAWPSSGDKELGMGTISWIQIPT